MKTDIIRPLNHRLAVLCLALFCAWTSAAQAATHVVVNLADSGPGSLRAALANAADGDTIDWDVSEGTILLTGGELLVTTSVTILDPRAHRLAVDGNSAGRVFNIRPNRTVSISGLTITNGNAPGGGGGIYNDHSSLTVSNCTLSGNSANNKTRKGSGGSIYNDGYAGSATLVIVNSTLSGNSANNGGGIYNDGYVGSTALVIYNSTLSGNSATAEQGGAIYNRVGPSRGGPNRVGPKRRGPDRGDATVLIVNSTLSGNSIAAARGGAIYNYSAVNGRATIEIGSTILDAGASGRNIYNQGGTVTSDGYNLSSDGGSGFLTATGDQINTDPLLGPLAENGGPTLTHALPEGSPAIDAGINFSEMTTDQRGAGFARTYDDPDLANVTGGDGTDIGAFELGEVTDRFPNGVAAGDVGQSGAVLWARAGKVGTVWFEYGTDPAFAVSDRTVAVAVNNKDVPAKLVIGGLQAGTQYYYRAIFGDFPSSPEALASAASGKFRTPFSDGSHGLRFGVSSCWNGIYRPFVSIRNVPERDLDFFVALGDTVYADLKGKADIGFSRKKYQDNLAQRQAPDDNFFAFARASTAFYATIDDHEVNNNFAGGAPPEKRGEGKPNYVRAEKDQDKPFFNETSVYTTALQAFHDYWPIREEMYAGTADPRTAHKRRLYRYRTFGNDAAIFMLDARSFRDEAPINGYKSHVTFLSPKQRNDLLRDLSEAQDNGITWKFVLIPEPIQNLAVLPNNDRFEAYAWERTLVLDYIVEHHIDNVVFISGDIHGTVANDLVYQHSKLGLLQKTKMWDISTGPVAHKALFGNFLIPLRLHIEGDRGIRGENEVFKTRFDALQLPYLWPTIGLSGSLYDIFDSRAKLLNDEDGNETDYLSINTYGWTEFDIDESQKLTVTTWGVNWYDETVPYQSIMRRKPFIASKFQVTPE